MENLRTHFAGLSPTAFKELFYISAEQYLRYIRQSDRFAGRNAMSVIDIYPCDIPSDYIFVTAEKVFFTHELQIWVRGQYISSISALAAITPKNGKYGLYIRDTQNQLPTIPNLKPSDIMIVSDLTFLIENLVRFYKSNPLEFTPPIPPSLPDLPEKFLYDLSDEQLKAVNGACCSNLSYISGAPGTGKTKKVLATCILRHVLNNKKVLLLAPTNNAVEQMLRGILPVLQDSGIELTKVYRIGTATEEFMRQYPEISGNSDLEKRLAEFNDQKKSIQNAIDEAAIYERKLIKSREDLDAVIAAHTEVSQLLLQLTAATSRYNNECGFLENAKESLQSLEETHKKALQAYEIAYAKLSATERTLVEKNALYERLRYKFWKHKQKAALSEEIATLLKMIPQYQEAHDLTKSNEATTSTDCMRAKNYVSICQSCVASALRRCDSLRDSIRKAASPISKYSSLVDQVLLAEQTNTDLLDSYIAVQKEKHLRLEEDAPAVSIDVLHDELKSIDTAIEKLCNADKLQQKKNALILAGTIDSTLNDLSPEQNLLPISHVFLDEAGYTSLARGMAVFACQAPITFLGDHHQLPPICEMTRIDPRSAPVCLWALPVSYLSELLCNSFEHVYADCYCQASAPSFHNIDFYPLNYTYRFGSTLATLLGKFIYGDDFQGVPDSHFTITVIDAPYNGGPYKRSSQAEASEISKYIHTHNLNDFAILTPYRDQVSLLRRTCHFFKENVLTVHRSQGREWNTVILSIVDASTPYFTDSSRKIGCSIINTAISRAKKELVIVCDTEAWKGKHGQLIQELIQLAQM